MVNWNLNTFSSKGIHSNKLKLCYINNSGSIKETFHYVLKNTELDLKDTCPVLYDYLNNAK